MRKMLVLSFVLSAMAIGSAMASDFNSADARGPRKVNVHINMPPCNCPPHRVHPHGAVCRECPPPCNHNHACKGNHSAPHFNHKCAPAKPHSNHGKPGYAPGKPGNKPANNHGKPGSGKPGPGKPGYGPAPRK